jgi:succinyl-diaminopimelate desuccinylase
MSETEVGPTAIAARLIRRPSVTPRDEGALALVAEALESLGFTCHRLVFGDDGSDEIHNLYAAVAPAGPISALPATRMSCR